MGLLDGRKVEDYKTYQAPMATNMSRQPKLTFSYSNDKPLDQFDQLSALKTTKQVQREKQDYEESAMYELLRELELRKEKEVRA